MAECDFCGRHARWRYTAASEPPEWNACDTCHILIGNGWWLNLTDRFGNINDEIALRRFEDFEMDRSRDFVALEDGSLATDGTWRDKTVPVGWRLDETQERWLPPTDDA